MVFGHSLVLEAFSSIKVFLRFSGNYYNFTILMIVYDPYRRFTFPVITIPQIIFLEKSISFFKSTGTYFPSNIVFIFFLAVEKT